MWAAHTSTSTSAGGCTAGVADQYPAWVDEHLPPRGPCAFCGNPDAGHRVIDSIVEAHREGDSVEALADNYDLPSEFVSRLIDHARQRETQSRM